MRIPILARGRVSVRRRTSCRAVRPGVQPCQFDVDDDLADMGDVDTLEGVDDTGDVDDPLASWNGG